MLPFSLSPAQRAAVESHDTTILCISGPGSGKTATQIARIGRLLCDGVERRSICAITFTNAAADEVKERLKQVSAADASEFGYIGTLHGLMLRLIQQHSAKLGYATDRIAVLDEEENNVLLKACAREIGFKGSIERVRECVLAAKVSPNPEREELAAKRYRQTLRANGLISYDLILHVGLTLLKQGIALPFDHLLVDEFQDSADIDADIYEVMPVRNRFFVGDPDQSIYGFRGARVANILRLAERVAQFFLEENNRSDRRICEVAQRLIEHNVGRVAKATRPVSTADGHVIVREFNSAYAEMLTQVCEIKECQGSTAVLLRYRTGQPGSGALVCDWERALVEAGVKVRRRLGSNRPKDWFLAKAMIAVLGDVENDWLCYNLVRIKDGDAKAMEIKLAAGAAGQSINRHLFHLPDDIQPKGWTPYLARLGVSPESISIVVDAIARVGVDASAGEIMAYLASDEFLDGQEYGEGVTVTTLHGAKGREFDNVFMPAFEQEIIPGTAKNRVIEEERRLAYVGFTRARHNLHISFCTERRPLYGHFTSAPATPSQFVAEAGLNAFLDRSEHPQIQNSEKRPVVFGCSGASVGQPIDQGIQLRR